MKCHIYLCDQILSVEVGFAMSSLSSGLISLTNQSYHLVDAHQRCPHMSQVYKRDLSQQPWLAFSEVQLGGRDRNFMHCSVLETSSFFCIPEVIWQYYPKDGIYVNFWRFLTDAHMEHWSFPLSVTWRAICGDLNKNSTRRLWHLDTQFPVGDAVWARWVIRSF